MSIKLTHIYAAEGKSHFGQLELETKMQEFAPPAPPSNLSEWLTAEQCRFVLTISSKSSSTNT